MPGFYKAKPGQSLADLKPELAAEWVQCVTIPDLTPVKVYPYIPVANCQFAPATPRSPPIHQKKKPTTIPNQTERPGVHLSTTNQQLSQTTSANRLTLIVGNPATQNMVHIAYSKYS